MEAVVEESGSPAATAEGVNVPMSSTTRMLESGVRLPYTNVKKGKGTQNRNVLPGDVTHTCNSTQEPDNC